MVSMKTKLIEILMISLFCPLVFLSNSPATYAQSTVEIKEGAKLLTTTATFIMGANFSFSRIEVKSNEIVLGGYNLSVTSPATNPTVTITKFFQENQTVFDIEGETGSYAIINLYTGLYGEPLTVEVDGIPLTKDLDWWWFPSISTVEIQVTFESVKEVKLTFEYVETTVSISGQLKNATDNPVQAYITVYDKVTGQGIASDSTDPFSSYYYLLVSPDTYHVQFDILNFFISNFWIKLISLDIFSNLQDVFNKVTEYPSENKVAFTVDITGDQEIQVYSSEYEPKTVKVKGVEIQKVSSYSELTSNTWYYSSGEKKLYIIANPTVTTTITSTSTTTTTLTTTTTITGTTTTSTTTTTIPGAEKTFGNTNVGASSYGWSENKILGSRYIAPENGIITKISWRTSSEGASGNAKAAVYSDSSGAPNTLLGNSTESTITSSSWVDFTFPNPVTITAGNAYWLIVWQQYSVWYRYDTGSPNQFVLKTATYGTDWPTLFGAADGFDNHNMSIYATYTPS